MCVKKGPLVKGGWLAVGETGGFLKKNPSTANAVPLPLTREALIHHTTNKHHCPLSIIHYQLKKESLSESVKEK